MESKNNLFITSGYFIHGLTNGHKEMILNINKKMDVINDKLIIIINNEHQQKLKYKTARTSISEIKKNIESYLNETDVSYELVESIDYDRTVIKTLRKIIGNHYDYDNIYFCNDGDVIEKCAEEKVINFLYLGNPKITNSGEEKN